LRVAHALLDQNCDAKNSQRQRHNQRSAAESLLDNREIDGAYSSRCAGNEEDKRPEGNRDQRQSEEFALMLGAQR
jgi:hypothetical protein